jgi:hypothetical protein
MNNYYEQPCILGREQHEWSALTYERTQLPNRLECWVTARCKFCFVEKVEEVRYQILEAMYRMNQTCQLCDKTVLEESWFYRLVDQTSRDQWVICDACSKNYR